MVLFNLSQHPAAKLHFPTQKFVQVYETMMAQSVWTESDRWHLTSIYSTVCDTDGKFILEKTYVETLLQGIAECKGGGA